MRVTAFWWMAPLSVPGYMLVCSFRVPGDMVLATAFAVVLLEGICTIVGDFSLFRIPFTSLVRHVAAMADCQGEHHLPIRSAYFYLREMFPNISSLSITSIGFPFAITFAVHSIELIQIYGENKNKMDMLLLLYTEEEQVHWKSEETTSSLPS